MSQRFLYNITGIQGVAAGAVATVNLPPNFRYHGLTLNLLANNVAADVTTIASNIKLKVGGVTIRDFSPAQAVNKAKMYKITPALGELPIFFSEPWMADPRIAEMFSWDMWRQGRFTMEITFLSPAGGPGVAAIVAEVDTIRNQRANPKTGNMDPFLRIIKEKSETFIFSGAGVLSNTNLDRSLPIRRLLCTSSANDVTTVELLADSVNVIQQITIAQMENVLNHYGIDGTFFNAALVFDFDDLGRSKLVAAGSLELKLNATGAQTLTIMNCQEATSFA